MTQAADITAQLRDFLSTLPEQKLRLLAWEINRARQTGAVDAAFDIVIDVVRDLARDAGAVSAESSAIQPALLETLAPFLASDDIEATGIVRVRRSSLTTIWKWLTENSENGDFQRLLADAAAAGNEDAGFPPDVIASLRSRAAAVIDRALNRVSGDERDRLRFGALVGGAEGMADLRTIAAVFRLDGQIADFVAELPPSPVSLSYDVTVEVTSRLLKFGRADIVYPLLILMKRLKSPHQLLSIVLSHEKTEDGQRLAESPLSPAITLLLDEIRQSSMRIVSTVGRDQDFDDLIRESQRFARVSATISGGIDLSGVRDWRTQISDYRRETSERLRTAVDKVFPRVRAMMGPLFGQRVTGAHAAVDKQLVVDGVRLLAALKPIRAELAINQVVTSAFNDLSTYVDNAGTNAAQAIREMPAHDRQAHLEAFDAFLQVAKLMLGDTYATALRRSAKIDEPAADGAEDDASAA